LSIPKGEIFCNNAIARRVWVKETKMTDEKKPPQGAAVSPVWAGGMAADSAAPVPGAAHIILTLLPEGRVRVQSFCFGRMDANGPHASEASLLAKDLPFALAELRLQLAEGRSSTMEEAAALRRHYYDGKPLQLPSGSPVTV
jgi:hypothetical protein